LTSGPVKIYSISQNLTKYMQGNNKHTQQKKNYKSRNNIGEYSLD